MKRDGFFALALVAVAVLAACQSSPTPPPVTTPVAPAPPVAPPPPVAVNPPPMSLPPSERISKDSCGADILADLVGKPRTAIPVPVDPTRRRVVCVGCPRTEDLRQDRLTIEYDQATNLVTSVMCQ